MEISLARIRAGDSLDRGRIPSSFRDPAGYVTLERGLVKRVVTDWGREDYEMLMRSGLYEELVSEGLLLEHTEEPRMRPAPGIWKVLRPRQLGFLSYPYEWCFTQLQEAALLTLDIQERALRYGMSLKDATPFNVQFEDARPVFIDTLSFERDRGGPWVAYEQFCRMFLAPLWLCSVHPGAIQHLRVRLEGFDLRSTSRALGWWTYFRTGALLHIHLHARAQRLAAGNGRARPGGTATNMKLALAASLRSAVRAAKPPRWSAWGRYAESNRHYSPEAAAFKRRFVQEAVRALRPWLVYDLGGNTGEYARAAASEGCRCVLFDADPLCIDRAYRIERNSGAGRVLPLVMDLTNPSLALGVSLTERQSLLERRPADLALALALTHHLRIHHAIPFSVQAELFAKLGRSLVAEYAPPEDPMVQEMAPDAAQRFPDYSLEGFRAGFAEQFTLVREAPVPGMTRRLLLFRR